MTRPRLPKASPKKSRTLFLWKSRKYLSLLRIRFIHGLQYRTAAYAGIATQFAWGAMRILLFRAFYRADPASFPMTFQALSSYVWLEQAFLALFAAWSFDNDIFSAIRDGSVAYELTRPTDLYAMWFTKHAAVRLSRATLRCMPILVVAAFLPKPYGISLPPSPWAFLLFVATAALGVCVVTGMAMLLYIAAFYTLNPAGLRAIYGSLADLLSGSLIPLPFFPPLIRTIVMWTPFGYIMDLPFRVYSGDLAGGEALRGAALQTAWCMILILAGRLWMKRALRRVVVQGG